MRPGARLRCSDRYERKARALGFALVAGLDEAGRGSLFGPVYAAAVILDLGRPIRGLNDSKQLEPHVRERLYDRIVERAVAWSVARAEAAEIDRINIYQASRLAMRRAVETLAPQPDYLFVDALTLDTGIGQRSLIHGDARCRSIAAASILAKVARDREMVECDKIFPGYGLASHKGYTTPEHLRALAQLGPTPEHRRTYEPVRLAADLAPAQTRLFAEGGTQCL